MKKCFVPSVAGQTMPFSAVQPSFPFFKTLDAHVEDGETLDKCTDMVDRYIQYSVGGVKGSELYVMFRRG